ncbi:sigma 54-interacting transcriptional regulator [bacterium]|nr:sigma 54-interacting transcriptional regulator [bacterium]
MKDLFPDDDLLSINQDLERKIARLSALYDITKALNSTIDRDDLLKLILGKTKELLDVEGASIIFWDKKKDKLYFPIVAEEGQIASMLKQIYFPTNSGIAGWVFREGRPALIHDVDKDERFYKKIDKSTDFKTRSILCVPLRGKKGIFGVLEAVNKKSGRFTQDDQHLLTAMADNVAISIEKATLYDELQKAEAFLRRENAELKKSVKQEYGFENIIGRCDKITNLIKKAEQVALTDAAVLIYGKTGTGKELLAQAIHNSSPRQSNKFVAINCGAIPENLLESELFGHEKGAFTSATSRRIGRFEEADGGTLFLDEIGDMPLNLQVKLLRVLQDGIMHRLGSNLDISVDVRLISATHQDLTKLVDEGKFRQDLFYRLKVFELEIPPLCERREDIQLLIEYFIEIYNKKLGKQIKGVNGDARDILYNYDYPGNIRELEHIIERAMILCRGSEISVDVFPKELRDLKPAVKVQIDDEKSLLTVPKNNKELKAAKAAARKKAEEKIERIFLNDLLSRNNGNVSEAARQANMNRSWLAQMVSKYKLDLSPLRKLGSRS